MGDSRYFYSVAPEAVARHDADEQDHLPPCWQLQCSRVLLKPATETELHGIKIVSIPHDLLRDLLAAQLHLFRATS